MPTAEEIGDLTRKVNKLSQSVEKLAVGKPAARKPSREAPKKVAKRSARPGARARNPAPLPRKEPDSRDSGRRQPVLTPQLATGPRRRARASASRSPAAARSARSSSSAPCRRSPRASYGLDLNELHAYVGVSSGSMIAAALANGITPLDMARLIITNESGDSLPVPPSSCGRVA